MLKKVLAVVMTCALALALTVPAFAEVLNGSSDVKASGVNGSAASSAVGTDGKVTISATARQNIPALSLVVTGKSGIVLNPYGLTVASNVFAAANGLDSSSTNQIISAPISVANSSGAPVIAAAKLVVTLGGGSDKATLASKPSAIKTTDTAKKIFLAVLASTTAADVTKKIEVGSTEWDSMISVAKNEGKILVGVDGTDGSTNNSLLTVADNSTGYFAFGGCMTPAPTGGWGAADTVKADLELTFRLATS